MWSHQNLNFVNAHSIYFLENCAQNFMKPKRFFLSFHLKLLNYVFLQSALRIFVSRLCRFPVLMAGSCYLSSLLVSQHCIAYQMRGWSEELEQATLSSYWAVERSLDVFLLSLCLPKKSTVPNVVFMYAKNNKPNLRFHSGNMNQLVMNLGPIQGIWFLEITSNNAVR